VSGRGIGNALYGMNSENSPLPNSFFRLGADTYQWIDNGVWGETQEFYRDFNWGIDEQQRKNIK